MDNLTAQRNHGVGDLHDAHEHEAERVARHVVRMPRGEAPPTISRPASAAPVWRAADRAPGASHAGLSAQAWAAGSKGGRPLDARTRGFFEPRLGRDLSQVRVHTGAAPEQMARGLQARAFTLGNDIVFGHGEYRPDTGEGKELLAHELVHVAQSDGTTIRRNPVPGATEDKATPEAAPTELKLEGTLDQRTAGFKELVKTTAVHRLVANQKNLSLWSLVVEQAIPSEDLAGLALSQSGGSRPYFELQDIRDPGVRELRAEQALGKYRACTGCHIEKDLHGTRGDRESASLEGWASPNEIRAQGRLPSTFSSSQFSFDSTSAFEFKKTPPKVYRPPAGSTEAKLNALFPDPEATRETLKRIEPIMQALGPQGYKVLPASMLLTAAGGKPDELRAAIAALIVQRQNDFGELIKKIQAGDVGWEHFGPIISSLLPSADAEVRTAIKEEMDDKAFWDKVEAVVVGILSVAALILTIFPPTTALGIAAFGALEISLGIYGVQKGSEMMKIGEAYGLATGADDVFSREQQEAGASMVFLGFVSAAGGWLQVFGGAARVASLAPKTMPISASTALAGTAPGVARVIQRGEFVITIGTDGSWFVTVASRPDLVIMVRGNTATLYQVLPNGGMRAMQTATLPGEMATPATTPLLLSAGDDAAAASTALVPRTTPSLTPPSTPTPRVLITPPPKEPKLLGTGNPTTYTWDEISRMQQPMLWQEREIYMQQLYGSPGQQHFPVPGTGGRFVDAPVQMSSGQLFAGEVKSYRLGWITIKGEAQMNAVPLSAKIEAQIAKDVYLRKTVPGYDPRWLFTDAPPTEALRQALRDNGIVFVEYLR